MYALIFNEAYILCIVRLVIDYIAVAFGVY